MEIGRKFDVLVLILVPFYLCLAPVLLEHHL